ncbi:porin [Massilia sp. LXY-6]|uniref:porin n=1 Tax=Massilia sp. LXY-6 TaxID=3379823 RepID=UPI003EDFA89E
MKKTLIGLAVLGTCMTNAYAQSSVTIYGIIDAGVTHVTNDNASRTTLEAGQMQVSRWGFRGQEELGGNLKAIFDLEGTLLNDTGTAGVGTGTPSTTSLFDREASVGLTGDFGTLTFGRQNILGVGSVGLADPMNLAFAATSPNVLFAAMNHSGVYGPFGANNGGTALRQNNSVKYISPYFHHVGFALMRAFGEQPGSTDKSKYEGASAFYHTGPFGASAAYARMTDITGNAMLKSYALGLRYTGEKFAIRSTYSSNELNTTQRRISVFGIGVDLPVAPALTLTGAVYDTRHTGDAHDNSQQYIAIAKYAFSKRSTGYVSIGRAVTDTVVSATQINLAQGFVSVGSDSANRFTMGIMHYF